MPNNKIIGIETENHVLDSLKELGASIYEKTLDNEKNGFYDFIINDKFIEVKSAQIWNKNGSNKKIRREQFGNFNFTRHGQLKELIENKAWVIFVQTWKGQKIILGALKAEQLKPIRRYYAPITILKKKPLSLEEFYNEL